MSYGISLHVWGEYACFTRPELKSERMSYEVMTPSAARGILSAIYWKPQFEWVIDRIRVLAPVRFTQVRRNELDCKIVIPPKSVLCGTKAATLGCVIEENRQQRSSSVLRNVSYVIDAHVNVIKEEPGCCSVAKHLEMFKRRASSGQCFHQPYFGTREFPAMFELVTSESNIPDTLPEAERNRFLGLMLHDLVYTPSSKGKIICANTGKKLVATPHFFMAKLNDGVLHVPSISETLT